MQAQIHLPGDLELGPDGKLYFADTNNNRVRRIDLSPGTIEAVGVRGEDGYSGDGGPALQATFNRPFGVAFDRFGNLPLDHRIVRLSKAQRSRSRHRALLGRSDHAGDRDRPRLCRVPTPRSPV